MGVCTNSSAGMVVVRDDRTLLIERVDPPYGWACPAGHVEVGEWPYQAAVREVREEVGLEVVSLTPPRWIGRREDNPCSKGSTWHDWNIYEGSSDGDPVLNKREAKSYRWASREELERLADITIAHMVCESGLDEQREKPGIEFVWIEFLTDLGWLKGPGE